MRVEVRQKFRGGVGPLTPFGGKQAHGPVGAEHAALGTELLEDVLHDLADR